MVGHLILKTYSNFANAKEQQKILYIFIIYYCISQSGWQAGIIIKYILSNHLSKHFNILLLCPFQFKFTKVRFPKYLWFFEI